MNDFERQKRTEGIVEAAKSLGILVVEQLDEINVLVTDDNLTVRELKEKALKKVLNNYLSTGKINNHELALLDLLN